MAWCHKGNKPLPEPIMAYFIDAYMHNLLYCGKNLADEHPGQ